MNLSRVHTSWVIVLRIWNEHKLIAAIKEWETIQLINDVERSYEIHLF